MPRKHEDPIEDPYGITVITDKEKFFEFYRWREAIKYWQDKIWSGQLNSDPQCWGAVMKIQTRQPDSFAEYASVTLLFSPGDNPRFDRYEAIGGSDREQFPGLQNFVHSGPDIKDFELSLARFARNREVRGVVLQIPCPAHVATLILANEHGRLRIGVNG